MRMEDIVSAGSPDYKLLTFSWDLIDVCQYNCSYCSAMNFNVRKFLKDPKLKKAWIDVIKKISMNCINMPFAVEILGGEPTLHQDIFEIVKSLCKIDNCVQVDLITNLAKPLKFYKKFNLPELSKLAIEASFHPEYDVEGYKTKVVELNNCDHITIYPNINLPTEEKLWDLTLGLIEYFNDNDVQIGLNFLQDVASGNVGSWKSTYPSKFWEVFSEYIEPGNYKYTPTAGSSKEQALNFLKSHAGATTIDIPYTFKNGRTLRLSEAQINQFDLRQFKGWSCKAMMYHVDMKGEIKHHCTGESIPIYKMTRKNLTCARICPLDRCDCDTKFLYEKSR